MLAIAVVLHGVPAADAPAARPDPLAQAVLDSLAYPPRTTPAALLDAAIRAADVDAFDVAEGYFSRLVGRLKQAGDGGDDARADLGDTADPAGLRRLERVLGDRVAGVREEIWAIRAAARQRRRDPERIARDVAALSDATAAAREAAALRLARAGSDALPALVELLDGDDPARRGARTLARRLVRELGSEGRETLLAWLASDDVPHWPGIIAALEAGITDESPADFADFLLAPALVADVPPAARKRALRLLERIAADRARAGLPAPAAPPSATAATASLTRRLDRVLSIDGLPAADHLVPEPVLDPDVAPPVGPATVDRSVWNPQARRVERVALTPRAARAQEAAHLARDLAALGATAPQDVRLVLLARLEGVLVTREGAADPLEGVPSAGLREMLSGPEGFDPEAVAEVLDTAAHRGMFPAAAAAARALDPADPAQRLRPRPRRSLLDALAVPDAALQFEAARTLARAGGDPPYRGSSRVADILLHAATSTGQEVVVVAHPDPIVRESLATGLSRFGYLTEKVATGREAILAARANVDTVLVMLAARTVRPTALESTQLIQRQPVGDVPPVLVVVDPLDDDARGKFLTCLLLKFADCDCVGIVDRLDSFFMPRIDPATDAVTGPPRFPDHFARVAGPGAVHPAAREARAQCRRRRAAEALALLADLGRRGWDVSAAETTARLAIATAPRPGSADDLHGPAVLLLGAQASGAAQEALLAETARGDLPEASKRAALAALANSVDRHGVLLESRPLRAVAARYNRASVPAERDLAAAVLDVLETSLRKGCPVSADAAQPGPTR